MRRIFFRIIYCLYRLLYETNAELFHLKEHIGLIFKTLTFHLAKLRQHRCRNRPQTGLSV